MNLQVTARHFELSERLEDMVKREAAALEKHFDGVKEVAVVLTNDRGLRHVDVTVRVPNHTLNSEAESSEQFDVLIPNVMKRASAQLQRYKEKLKKL